MKIESVMVTGANRGIGLELVRQLANLPKPPRFIFATYRNRNTVQALKEIRDASKETQILLIKMDIRDTNARESARKIVEDMVGDKGLNLLINNAAALKQEAFPEITEETLQYHFLNNTVGPVLLLKEMFPLLQKAAARQSTGMSVSRAAILNISSESASQQAVNTNPTQPLSEDDKKWLGTFSYKTSKVALNMAMRVIALTVKDQGILLVSMCPGWVKTDMGTVEGLLEISESVSAIMKTIPQLHETHHGTFIDRNAKLIPY